MIRQRRLKLWESWGHGLRGGSASQYLGKTSDGRSHHVWSQQTERRVLALSLLSSLYSVQQDGATHIQDGFSLNLSGHCLWQPHQEVWLLMVSNLVTWTNFAIKIILKAWFLFILLLILSWKRKREQLHAHECKFPSWRSEDDPLEVELQIVVGHLTRVLGTEFWSSARATWTLNWSVLSILLK